MSVTIGQNIGSLKVQRALSQNSEQLSAVNERLSSGMRINRAVDDAAGLAIVSSLSADRRVYGQAIRNANDGLSALNIAEGALQQLSGIVTRISELAEQSANGVYSASQRQSLDNEAQALRREYERITESTEFNGLSLLNGRTQISLQVDKNSYRADGTNDGQISLTLGSAFATARGDGTFTLESTFTQNLSNTLTTGDFNGDGQVDLAFQVFSGVTIRLANGDGTFANGIPSSGGPGSGSVPNMYSVDLDLDGVLDLVTGGTAGTRTYLNDGSGNLTFSENFLGVVGRTVVGDLNGDGYQDLVASDEFGDSVSIYLNDGDGTFTEVQNFSEAGYEVRLQDLNNDGNLDLITEEPSIQQSSIRLGDGSGNFGSSTVFASTGSDGAYGDVNGDGIIDRVSGNSYNSSAFLQIGNGDGTFAAATGIPGVTFTGSTALIEMRDLNGDGALDIVRGNGSIIEFFLNDGSGNFSQTETLNEAGAVFGDMNGDSVADLISFNSGTGAVSIYSADTNFVGAISEFSLATRADALSALDQMKDQLSRIASEIGLIGSVQSRLDSAIRNLMSRNNEVTAAQSRILDVDMASESAAFVQSQIKQQASTFILSQANQLPALAITLLG